MKQLVSLITAGALACSLTACSQKSTSPRDPYEKFNRTMYAFNNGMDHAVIRPFTRLYQAALPGPLRRRIVNVLHNASETVGPPNDLLQGKFSFFLHDVMRIVMNTTLGIGGIFDVASHYGLKKHPQGFGMTLAYYSPKGSQSPYLVVPFLGFYTFRTGLGSIVNYYSQPVGWIGTKRLRYPVAGTYLISKRSELMGLNPMIDEAFDPYVFVRNAFFQIHDKKMQTNLLETTPNKPVTLPPSNQPNVDGSEFGMLVKAKQSATSSAAG